MTYQERSIAKGDLEKTLSTLDSDEGIRIDDDSDHIFVNKTSRRYCIDISKGSSDEFVYRNSANEVMDLLKGHIQQTTKIFAY
jgi:hypothetical protein